MPNFALSCCIIPAVFSLPYVQFVFIYHGCEEPRPSPPPSSLDQRSLLDSMQESWDSAGCIDAVQ